MTGDRSIGTVVLIHGAWHGAWCWDLVVDELRRRDITVVAPDLPFTGLDDDAAVARAAIESAGDNVVICAHSYGGIVASEAAKGLPGVQHIVYLAAFMTEAGEGLVELATPFPSVLLEALTTDDEGRISVDPERAQEVFYGDSSAAVAAACTARLRPMPASLMDVVTRPEPAWKTVPATTFVLCTADHAVAPDLQRVMAARATEVLEWPADHSPFLTRPDELSELIVSRFSGLTTP